MTFLKITFLTLLRFLAGVLSATLIYVFIISKLDLSSFVILVTFVSASILLGVACVFSREVCAISLLTVPASLGKSGRSVLKGLIVGYLLTGPLNNMIQNANEVVRIFNCGSILGSKLQIAKIGLMYKPFEKAFKNMHADLSEVNDTLNDIDDIITPLKREIEDKDYDSLNAHADHILRTKELETGDAENYEKLYLTKMETRCNGLVENATKKCESMFRDVLDLCYATLSGSGGFLLCAAMELDNMCNREDLFGSEQPCDAKKHMKRGVGSHLETLISSNQLLKDEFKPADVRVKLKDPKFQPIDMHVENLTGKVLEIVKEKRNTILGAIKIVNTILAFLYLKVLWAAFSYVENYLTEISFDNSYITKYFKKIDDRRSQSGKTHLLPLKKVENWKLIDYKSWRMRSSDVVKIFSQLVMLLLGMFMATLFIIVDLLFCEALLIVRKHAEVQYTQTGSHNFTLKVKGGGMVAKMVKSVMSDFDIEETIHAEMNNTECLPDPSYTDGSVYYKIYGGYFLIFLSLIFNIYFLKLNRLTCAIIYPKREKCRTLYLYNKCLRKRKIFLREIRSHITTSRKEDKMEEYYDILGRLPWIGRFFRTSKCAICRDELKKSRMTCIKCKSCYCLQCWEDFLSTCQLCIEE